MTPAPRSHHRYIGGVHRLHADDVIATIDMMHFASDAGGEITQQINASAADIFDRNIALKRRIQTIPFQDIIEVADPPGGQRIDRTGGNRVHADVVAAEIDGEIAHTGFERRLCDPHYV